jgi:hypothetical protein
MEVIMVKVQCRFCKFESSRICSKKGRGVNIKKKRECKFYQDDANKLQSAAERRLNSSKPEVTFRPDWYWNRKEVLKKLKEEEKGMVADSRPSIFTGDPSHPVTGDLSRFFSSTVK